MADTAKLRELYDRHKGAVAFVEVETREGDIAIGTAFHIGQGVFVTARHVVEHVRILDLCATQGSFCSYQRDHVGFRRRGGLQLVEGPFFHPNPRCDVACFLVDQNHLSVYAENPYPPAIQLGGHLDDWLSDDAFTCSEVLVLGYPPVPLSTAPQLFAVPATISALVDKLRFTKERGPGSESPSFIVSCTARGGFSGGPALSEWGGFSMGVVTEAFVRDHHPVETGFMGVLSVEAIYDCLAAAGLLPPEQLDWLGEDGSELFGGREHHARRLVTPRTLNLPFG